MDPKLIEAYPRDCFFALRLEPGPYKRVAVSFVHSIHCSAGLDRSSADYVRIARCLLSDHWDDTTCR